MARPKGRIPQVITGENRLSQNTFFFFKSKTKEASNLIFTFTKNRNSLVFLASRWETKLDRWTVEMASEQS